MLEIQSSLDGLELLWEQDPLARSYRVLHSPDPGAEFELLADDLQDPLYVVDPIEQQGFFKLQAIP